MTRESENECRVHIRMSIKNAVINVTNIVATILVECAEVHVNTCSIISGPKVNIFVFSM